ncbi:MAG: crossover junction endodeoxyribonuclease RuvC [Candidatus Doudnabacteria bacterium]|nr:crossover junction endodeoxyribonuclease RuvC [Candidatus Doudnabacteria bacterium]
MQRILGIDVGTAIVGWSVLEKSPTHKNGMTLIDYGVITTESTIPMPKRLDEIFHKLHAVIEYYKPTHSAIESLFYFKNQTTVMSVSQGRGVILLVCQQKDLEIAEYTPLQVKQAVTGYGRAEKKQVQQMVRAILGLKEIPKPDDAADAIAIAICHAQTMGNRLKTVT